MWQAHFGGARLTRFSPDGKVIGVLEMPVPQVTSCAFGGPNLDTLYITTARKGMNAAALARHPLSGSLFACRPGVRGLPVPPFAG